MAWGVENQSFGAAVVCPLYCLVHFSRFDSSPIGPVDQINAKALLFSSLVIAATPVWLLVPLFVNYSSETRQLLIGSYRLTPLILPFLQPLIAGGLATIRSPVDGKRGVLRKRKRLSLLIVGTTAAAAHIYTLIALLLSQEVSPLTVFLPWAAAKNDQLTTELPLRGCRLFIQNDILIIALTLIPYSTMIFQSHTGHGEKERRSRLWILLLPVATLVAVVLSPGALLAFALASVL